MCTKKLEFFCEKSTKNEVKFCTIKLNVFVQFLQKKLVDFFIGLCAKQRILGKNWGVNLYNLPIDKTREV